ncbi:polysaccharide biosynthesis tyrosine autokinase [Tessaracoccus sp. MC1627]|nr:polysaccharide biosynthesis tyrosine autokinase [Tessaracoccus sp. MC1627]
MELEQYLRIVQRYWRSSLATLFACIAIAAVVTLLQKPTYSSTASVFLAVESGGTAGELSQGATYAERQVKSFVTVATSAMVLEPVISNLRLDLTRGEVAGKLTVTAPIATSVIEIQAEDRDPALAADLANSVADSLQAAVGQLAPPSPDGAALVSATVIDTAQVPIAPTAPRPAVNLALGAVLGLMLALGQAVLRSLADTRLRTTQDIEALTDAPVLASVGRIITSAGRAADDDGQHWQNAEAYRRLRTNVGFLGLGGERRSSFVVTSATAGEGKTETVINLARVLAQAGESVLLIDADLRRPQVGARLHLDGELGLSDVLSGRAGFSDLVFKVGAGTLDVLPAGTIPPNPSELLGSEAMAQLLASVERQYDFVLFDSPPLLPVTDAIVLSAQTGGAVLVTRSGVVRRAHVAEAIHMMDTADVSLLGVVLNDVPVRAGEAYAAYYSAAH